MSDERTAVVLGAGDVGAAVLRHLAGSGEFNEVWALDIDAERARLAVHDAVAIASYTRSAPRADLRDAVAELWGGHLHRSFSRGDARHPGLRLPRDAAAGCARAGDGAAGPARGAHRCLMVPLRHCRF